MTFKVYVLSCIVVIRRDSIHSIYFFMYGSETFVGYNFRRTADVYPKVFSIRSRRHAQQQAPMHAFKADAASV